jgi:opine dehydrogenase
MQRKITILGGGNGARTAAAEISLLGHQVTLYEIEPLASQVAAIKAAGYIEAHGSIQGWAPINVELDLKKAVGGSELILVIVPTMYQINYVRPLAPLLQKGQSVALMPGSLGALEFRAELDRLGGEREITIGEFAALPYATRIQSPVSVHVFGRRRYVSAGIFPASEATRVMPVYEDIYPGIERMRDVLEAGLSNPNPTLHCLGVLLNMGRIEQSRGEFYYYDEGLTYHVCKAVEAIDQERLAIGHALGLKLLSLLDTYWKMGYGPKGNTFWEVIRGVKPLVDIKGPSSADSRYLTEDVPIGLVIYSQLGRLLGAPANLMESVIHIAGALLGRNFFAEGRTLERCGIAGMSGEQIIEYVRTGRKP